MNRLIMIRHGKSEANENYDILFEKEDSQIELVDQGYLDAINAGRNLKVVLKQNRDHNPTFVVSPYTRTIQTFRIIAAVNNISEGVINVDEGVIEHFMNLKGNLANWERFSKYKESNWSVKENADTKYEGGESLNDVRKRARDFISNAKLYFEEENSLGLSCDLVLVAHGLFIKMVMAELDSVDPDTLHHPENGELVIRELPEYD